MSAQPAHDPSELSDEDRSTINQIWKFLRRPADFDNDHTTWPCTNIQSYVPHLVPPAIPEAGPCPTGIAMMLETDFRMYSTFYERSDHASFTITSGQVKKMHEFWLKTLHRIMHAFMNCQRPRTETGLAKAIINCLNGLNGNDDNIQPEPEPKAEPVKTEETTESEESELDLNQSIRAITSIFTQSDRPTGEETEPFKYRLQPILDQMDSANIPEVHRVSVLFSVLTGKARDIAKAIRTRKKNTTEFVQELNQRLVEDQHIQGRKANRWKLVSYNEFRAKATSDLEATQKCIDHLNSHQMDLPAFLNNEPALLDRLRDVFKDQEWCQSLYEKTHPNMSPHAFAELMKTAASNNDAREKRKQGQNGTPTFAVGETKKNQTPSIPELVAAFFARTPPPPRYQRPRKYQHRRYPRRYRKPPPAVTRRTYERTCYGCGQTGHIIRNCPEKEKYRLRMKHFRNIGTAALIVLEDMNSTQDQTDEALRSAAFLEEIEEDNNDRDTEAFDTWICELLDTLDKGSAIDTTLSQTGAYFIRESLSELQQAMEELMHYAVLHNVLAIYHHLLVDIGAPKSLCSEPWLFAANWKPVKSIPVPNNIKPFRFAGTGIQAQYIACLVAILQDTNGNKHVLRQVTFVLPPTPIPYLVGLQTARDLSFDIALRKGNGSHLHINKFESTYRLIVNSHAWLQLTPCNEDPDPNFNWDTMIRETLKDEPTETAFTDLDNIPTLDITGQSAFLTSYDNGFDNTDPPHNSSHVNLIPPWERDDWNSKMTSTNIEHLHKVLRHPPASSLIELFRQQREGRRVPEDIKDRIKDQEKNCGPCAEHPELPRRPKISIPHTATPNISVTLDVMPKTIRFKQVNFLVMLDAGDAMLKLSVLSDDSARTAFNSYLLRWISYFDASVFTVVDRGSNLNNEHMGKNLRTLDSQLCPIPTEAPWSIGNNERSHRFLKRVMNKIMTDPEYDCGDRYERLISDTEMSWNMNQHSNRILPHFNRYGVMPRVLGELDNSPTTQHRIALMEIARVETERLRANQVLNNAMRTWRRHVTTLTVFTIGQVVWFFRRKYGWRKGTVVRIDRPTIFVEYQNKLFPTHENRVRPYFGESSIPPEIRNNDTPELESIDRPSLEPTTTNDGLDHSRVPVSQLINSTYIVRHYPNEASKTPLTIRTEDNHIVLLLSNNNNGTINSDEIISLEEEIIVNEATFLTTTEYFKTLKTLTPEAQGEFKKAKLDEIRFLLDQAIEEIIREKVDPDCDLQPLKWILAIKRSPNIHPPIRYRARLVSASHLSTLRHALNGTAPTISLSSLRILLAIAPTWNMILAEKGDTIAIVVRDVTKAYLQSQPTKRLVYYQPPTEYYEEFPEKKEHVWKDKIQLYGEVEAGKYWHRTFVPWLCENILDYEQSIYDPSLLFSTSHFAATALCTDDALTVMPTEKLHEESKMATRFKCRDAQYLPTDFKGVDISKDKEDIIISQTAYASKLEISQDLDTATKPEISREMNEEEVSKLRSDAGKLAWMATATSPTSAFQSSVALQRLSENKIVKIPQLRTLLKTRQSLTLVKEQDLAKLRYIPLDHDTIHIRVYSDGSFQNLDTKHSQIGFLTALADKDDNFNIVHWHSSKAPKRAKSTEASELMALDAAFQTLEHTSKVIYQLIKREIPIVVYIDCEVLWRNLMKETRMCMAEEGYRVREVINNGSVTSVCLLSGSMNPADALTKEKPNLMLKIAVTTNKCVTPCRNTFMLQDSPHRHLNYIPTMRVPMPDDDNDDEDNKETKVSEDNTKEQTMG